jgi:protein arginine kinase
MNITPILEAKSELTHGTVPPGPVVLSSRIRLARNLQSFSFPGRASESVRRQILSICGGAAANLKQMQKATVLNLQDLDDLERRVLVERHLISRELSQLGAGAGVIISKDQSCSIMINEEDHLRIQVMRSGYHINRIWRTINAIDSALEEHIDYAFSDQLGYLTACPTNLGTGLRASVMLHLPGLVIANHMEQVVRALNQIGLTVRGLFGEGSDATGSIFQISNQQTLGESEETILKRLLKVLGQVIEQEENARYKLLETERSKVFDRIGRCFGILQHAHILNSAEAMNCLSLVRLAIDLGLLPEEHRILIDRLFIHSQPGHVQLLHREQIDSDRRDIARAAFIREESSKLPPLNFDNLC